MKLHASGNTYNSCLLILFERGYRLSADEVDERLLWNAEKDGRSFSAFSPPELLGIVTLGERFGEGWNRQHPDVLGEVLGTAGD